MSQTSIEAWLALLQLPLQPCVHVVKAWIGPVVGCVDMSVRCSRVSYDNEAD